MKVQGNSLEAVQYAVNRELGYRGKRATQANEASKHAMIFLANAQATDAATFAKSAPSGLTYEQWVRGTTENYVRRKMGVVGIWTLLSFILGPLISAVVQLVVNWWFERE